MKLAYTYRFLSPAKAELQDETDTRESWTPGSGDAFLTAVDKAIESILEMPTSWKNYPGWERKPEVKMRSVTKYPYDIIYFLDDKTVVIVAVAYEGRRPMYWADRIQEASQ